MPDCQPECPIPYVDCIGVKSSAVHVGSTGQTRGPGQSTCHVRLLQSATTSRMTVRHHGDPLGTAVRWMFQQRQGGESHHRRHCSACAHGCRDQIYEYMVHFRFIEILELRVCVCVCVCVIVCECACVCEWPWLQSTTRPHSRIYRICTMRSFDSRVATVWASPKLA